MKIILSAALIFASAQGFCAEQPVPASVIGMAKKLSSPIQEYWYKSKKVFFVRDGVFTEDGREVLYNASGIMLCERAGISDWGVPYCDKFDESAKLLRTIALPGAAGQSSQPINSGPSKH